MTRNMKSITPRCGLCKHFYSSFDDDGSGLCPQCRPSNSIPLLTGIGQLKKTIVMEVGKVNSEDFDQEVSPKQDLEENKNELGLEEIKEPIETIRIEDIIKPGRFGITNSQMVPALKEVIAEQSVEKVALLKQKHLYIFKRSLRYLKKAEREFIEQNQI